MNEWMNVRLQQLPDTKSVCLIGQMDPAIEVEGLQRPRSTVSKEILGAAWRGQIREIASVLRHFDGPHASGGPASAQSESQVIAGVWRIHIHCVGELRLYY